MIPKAYHGKYIYPKTDGSYDYNNYLETTTSNAIISGTSSTTAPKGIIPILYRTTTSSRIIYDAYNVDNIDDVFIFYTNNQSKRELILGSRASSGWSRTFIHANDINK